jgi:hypothetical protein
MKNFLLFILFASSYQNCKNGFFAIEFFWKLETYMKRFSKKVVSIIYSLEDDHTCWAKGTRGPLVYIKSWKYKRFLYTFKTFKTILGRHKVSLTPNASQSTYD